MPRIMRNNRKIVKLYVGFHCRIQDALKKNIKRDKQVSQNCYVFRVDIRYTGV